MWRGIYIAGGFALAWVLPLAAQGLPDPVGDADYRPVDIEAAKLGQLLFYDPLLSGNRTVACATCHHPAFGTSDGVSLSIGDGGLGLGPARRADPDHPPEARIPRNAPALFNLGAYEFTSLFHDGRLEEAPDWPGGLRTPMDADMVSGFASALSAQTMFPVLSQDEMAGTYRTNDVGRAVRQGRITGQGGAWDIITRRVTDVPEYAARFAQVYAHIEGPGDVAFTDVSNAIASFMEHEWRSDSAPFDAVLRGETVPQGRAGAGMNLFYGRAGCAECHAGKFQTDHDFHPVGTPQIGPGKAMSFESHHRDEGRFRVTGDPGDLYAFRTPSLRNVTLTAPYGHAGSHLTLRGFIADHVDPVAALDRYDPAQAVLPKLPVDDLTVMSDPAQRGAIADASTMPRVLLSRDDLFEIEAFLGTLTDPAAAKGRLGIPDSLPSGLQVPRH